MIFPEPNNYTPRDLVIRSIAQEEMIKVILHVLIKHSGPDGELTNTLLTTLAEAATTQEGNASADPDKSFPPYRGVATEIRAMLSILEFANDIRREHLQNSEQSHG